MRTKRYDDAFAVVNTDTINRRIPADVDRLTLTVDTPANVTVSVCAHPNPDHALAVFKAATLTDGMMSINGPITAIRVVATGNANVNILGTGD